MPKDAHASLRLPADLKREVENVADFESRPVSSTLELLVRRGLNRYKEDGILVEVPGRPTRKPGAGSPEEELAHHMADLVADRLMERLSNTKKRNIESPKRGKL